jgi:hypothetical protein
MMKPCPHCGATDAGFFRNVRAFGWCEEQYDGDGVKDQLETSNLGFTNTKVIRCLSCLEIRRDVRLIGNVRVGVTGIVPVD